MTTLNITLDQVDEQMKRLQEIKMFLENVKLPSVVSGQQETRAEKEQTQKQTMNLVIHEYWKK